MQSSSEKRLYGNLILDGAREYKIYTKIQVKIGWGERGSSGRDRNLCENKYRAVSQGALPFGERSILTSM